MDLVKTQAHIDDATRAAAMSVGSFSIHHGAELALCTRADQDRILLRAGLSFLFGHGLVTAAPEDAWKRWLPVDPPEPFKAELCADVAEAVARRRAFDAAARAVR